MFSVRWLLLALLLLVGSVANATIPAQGGYQVYLGASSAPSGATLDAACDAAMAWVPSQAAAVGAQSITAVRRGDVCNGAAATFFTDGVRGGAPYSCTVAGCNYGRFSFNMRSLPASCPANSTPASGGGCQCNAGYQQNQAGTACVAACQFGNNISSGFFDYGAQVSGSPPVLVCSGGCAAVFLGEVPAGSAVVNGTKHYFAKGSYQTTGGTCTEGTTPGAPSSNPTVPADSCGPNQTMGVINGKATCVWQQDSTPGAGDAGKPAPTNEPDKPSNPSTSSTTTNNTVTNNNGSTTTTSTTVVNNGNGTSTTTTTTTNKDPNGNVTGTSTTSETTGKQTDDQVKQDKCQKNSSDAGCGGTPKDISGGGLYTPKEATVKGVLEGARDTLMASPIGSGVVGFFSVSGGGSCPRSTGTIPWINATVSIDAFCSDFAAMVFAVIRTVLLVVAGFMAFRIAIDN